MTMNVLLITGAIDVKSNLIPLLEVTNCEVRLSQYIHSIKYSIDYYTNITHVVFCENTNYNFDYSELCQYSKQKGKVLEIIKFTGNYDLISNHGKGYGEGEIIKYALIHSKILTECTAFYKLTGRVIIRNMDSVIRATKSNNAFIYYPSNIYRGNSNFISTIFYKTDKIFYETNLINEYQKVEDRNNQFLEYLFLDILKNHPIKSFGVYPLISGQSGTTGLNYDLSKLKNTIEEIANFCGIHDLKQNCLSKTISFLISSLVRIR